MKGTQSHSDSYELQIQEYEPLSKSYLTSASCYEAEIPVQATKSWRTRFSGWRGGMVASIMLVALVLSFNITLAIAAATRWQRVNNLATAFTGDCTLASRWMTGVHLAINLFSSLLLGASNYCMQRLVAPTRKEIDNAHAERKCIDVGIPSIKNLTFISKSRLVPWILLALSSIPLHLIYNSVVFQTIGTNEVYVAIVTEEFFTNKLNGSSFPYSVDDDTYELTSELQETLLDGQYLNQTAFDNITIAECKSRYVDPLYISSGSCFIVIARGDYLDPTNQNWTVTDIIPYVGKIGDSGSLDPTDTAPYRTSYCLSQRVPPRECTIQISQTILYSVIVCNILKIGVMVFILWRLSHETTIVTIGDAINSFLRTPDPTTENCCLISARTVNQLWKAPLEVQRNQTFEAMPRERWGVACSKRRWCVLLILSLSAIIVVGILIRVFNLQAIGFDGFGKISPESLSGIKLPHSKTSVIPFVLLANLPQAIVSFIYLVYNGQFTAMLAHREWSNYAVKRAPLRVTNPSPTQRSTYYLQLPYMFGIPLLLASVGLHWLISQSIFLVRIVAYQDGEPHHSDALTGDDPSSLYLSTVGYSYAAVVASLSLGCALVVAVVAFAWYGRYPTGLPVGGMNSAVISAACHIKHEESGGLGHVSDRPLKWGVVIPGSEDDVGHCSFSSGEVGLPQADHLYAG